MSLVQIEKPMVKPKQKVQHLASDIVINATEKQCSGVRVKEVDGEKQYCVLGLLGLYTSK